MNLIPVCTWLTYDDYIHSAGVGKLGKNMCYGVMKPAYLTICIKPSITYSVMMAFSILIHDSYILT